MRQFRLPIISPAIIALSFSALGLPAFAQTPVLPDSNPRTGREAKAQTSLDQLFASLKRERNPEKARGIASQIIRDLARSQSSTVNLLMQWAADAANEKRNAAALDFLDRVTLLQPDYAEGWARRATLHYSMGNPAKAMSDIAQALHHEPRHLGALAGLAGILTEAERDQAALTAWQDYLALYPADREAQEAMFKLSEKIAGDRT